MHSGQDSTGTSSFSEGASSKLYDEEYSHDSRLRSQGTRRNPSKRGTDRTGPGRKKVKSTQILSQLTSKSGLPVTKENIRIQFIRCDSDKIKEFLKPGKIAESNPLLDQMKKSVLSNTDVFVKVCKVQPIRKKFKSFGKDFCRAYFKHEKVREFHRLHIDLIFGAKDPASLCTSTNQRCCINNLHTPACVEVWKQVRIFLQLEMFQELDKVNHAKTRPETMEPGPELEELHPELKEVQSEPEKKF